MALSVKFNIEEPVSATKFVFTDTTGDYNAITNPGGYGAPNLTRAGVTATRFLFTLPDGTSSEINKTFLPLVSTDEVDFLPEDFAFTTYMDDGVWTLNYKVYGAAVLSGAIAAGVEYRVLGYTSVTYNGVVYGDEDIFIGVTGVTTFTTSGSGTVVGLEDSYSDKFLLYAKARNALQDALLNEDCGCGCDDFQTQKKISWLVAKLGGLVIAFEQDKFIEANKGIRGISAQAETVCDDC